MKIAVEVWDILANHLKNKILAKYDPATIVAPNGDLHAKLTMLHEGFYVSIYDSAKNRLVRTGFLQKDCENILDSAYRVVESVYIELQSKGNQYKKLLTGQFFFAVIWDVVHINNGLAWDENEDGIHFSWGDRYKGLYLPYEVQQMTVPKTEIMNRLCSWETGVPSNLWRIPCGMCSKIISDSFTL